MNIPTTNTLGAFSGEVSLTCGVPTTEGTADTPILDDTNDNTLMMIPHPDNFTAGEDASITINFTPSGSTARNLTCSLTGTKWERGKHITYTITTDGLVWEYVLEATGGSTTYAGGSVSYSVKSYRYKRTNTSVKEAVAWQIVGYKADGASDFSASAPSWLTVGSGQNSGTGKADATAESKSVTVAAQTSTTSSASFTSVERGTSSDPYDLSTHDFYGNTTTRNTANCYVVNAPGWYKIPLVYGNGIKNGSNNTSAYNSSTFVDYNNNQIRNLTGPYLKYSGTIGTAGTGAPIIVWQDVNGMVTNLSVAEATTENGYLKFYIAPNKIAEGNAVLAVKDSNGTIMWSWHIWVTATSIYQTITITGYDTNYSYQLMPVNLGWVSAKSSTRWSGRGVRIQIKQANTNENAITYILQAPHKIPSHLGDNPFYQWGRKDAFPGGKYSENGQKSAWNNSGSSFSVTFTSGKVTCSTAIRTPTVVYNQSTAKLGWCSTSGLVDLWNAGTATTGYVYGTVEKSIYDPNPFGFKMPPSRAYTGIISTDEINENNLSNVHGTYYDSDDDGRGWDFYTLPSNEHFFIPGTGQIRAGAYKTYHNGGCIWTAFQLADNAAPYFYTGLNNSVGPQHGLETESGHSIRPIME